ncbi:unnamed protein product [Hymenolepis diminuta]|uniref:Uncharacterized protein n=1 Tax=Hymenolepis diminuta TaxID=6216 RepID=A0A564YM63_HYMDI|nr:unnamed protein product [Hymenolepis diminuta]
MEKRKKSGIKREFEAARMDDDLISSSSPNRPRQPNPSYFTNDFQYSEFSPSPARLRKKEKSIYPSTKRIQHPRHNTYLSEQEASDNIFLQNQPILTADSLEQRPLENTRSENHPTTQRLTQQKRTYNQVAYRSGQGVSKNVGSVKKRTNFLRQSTQRSDRDNQLEYPSEALEPPNTRRKGKKTTTQKLNQEVEKRSTKSTRLPSNTELHNLPIRKELKQSEFNCTWMTTHETPNVATQIKRSFLPKSSKPNEN